MVICAKERNTTRSRDMPVGGWSCKFRGAVHGGPHQEGRNGEKPPRRAKSEPEVISITADK